MYEFAVLDPKSDRAARVIAGYRVHSEADQLDDIQSLLDRADDFFRRVRAAFQIKVRRTDRDYARRSAAAVAGGLRAKFPCRVCAVKIIPENAVFDDGRGLGRHAFVI